MAEWTVERNNDFIQAVRERELLYNMELKEYHDRNKKVDAWNAVGALFGIDGTAAAGKFNNLRDTHRTALKKEAKRSGAPADGKKAKVWAHLEAMSFLKNFKDNRKTQSTLTQRPTATPPSAAATPNGSSTEELQEFTEMPEAGGSEKKSSKRKAEELDDMCYDALKRIRERRERQSEKTEAQLFGELIVKQLELLDDATRRRTQGQILSWVADVVERGTRMQPSQVGGYWHQPSYSHTLPPDSQYASSSHSSFANSPFSAQELSPLQVVENASGGDSADMTYATLSNVQ